MIFTEAQVSRYYPNESLAAHALGFVGSDLQGLYGLEYSYNDVLSGEDGYYLYAKDANGNSLPTEFSTYVSPKDGYSIVTTIDSYIQEVLESQLETIRINHGVQNRVTGIVMDTSSGAILGMATSSPFNPNNPYELDDLSSIKLKNSGYANGSEPTCLYFDSKDPESPFAIKEVREAVDYALNKEKVDNGIEKHLIFLSDDSSKSVIPGNFKLNDIHEIDSYTSIEVTIIPPFGEEIRQYALPIILGIVFVLGIILIKKKVLK
jgi:cell division protein FtsI/penicillin-binding protein 2